MEKGQRLPSTNQFWTSNRDKVKELLSIRNNSLLAHGYSPITNDQWVLISKFFEGVLMPYLLQQFSKFKIDALPAQLPREWIDDLQNNCNK